MSTWLSTISETHIISPSAVNSFRLCFNRVVPGVCDSYPPVSPQLLSVVGQPHPPGLQLGSGISQLNYPQNPGAFWTTNRNGFNNDINLTRGTHSLQFGGMLERMRYNANLSYYRYGERIFGSLQNFLGGVLQQFSGHPAQYAQSRDGFRQSFLALYAHDNWKVAPRLTLNLGLRWEPYTIPNEVHGLIANQRNLTDAAPSIGSPFWQNKSWTNFSPRFGFAWSPTANGKTAVRGGLGVYYVPLDSAIYTTQIGAAYPLNPSIGIQNPDPQYFPNALAAIAAHYTGPGSNVGLTGLEYNNSKTPHALEYGLNVQQRFSTNNVLTIGYSGRRGINLTSLGDYNLPPLTYDGISMEIPANPIRYNPSYTNIDYIATNANSWCNAMTASFQRRFSAGLQAQVSYTYTSALDDTDTNDNSNHVGSGGAGSLKRPPDLTIVRTPRHHRLNF